MAFRERHRVDWYCGHCKYSTDKRPLNTTCSACGHGDIPSQEHKDFYSSPQYLTGPLMGPYPGPMTEAEAQRISKANQDRFMRDRINVQNKNQF